MTAPDAKEMDLVGRLREKRGILDNKWPGPSSLELEAAAEIERLTSRARDVRAQTVEECAKWHEHEADIIMNSLHCGDNSSTIASHRRRSDWHSECAGSLRKLNGASK
jgi:hypothetical protein